MKRAVIGSFVLGSALAAQALETVYYDNFDGSGAATLNGTTPDQTMGASWSAHASMLNNGYPVNANDASALLPITLQSDKLYRLSVELTPAAVTADNDWLGFGFNASSAVSGAGATPNTDAGRFNDSGIQGKVWAILREAYSNSAGDQDIQFFSSVTSGQITTTETDAGFNGMSAHTAVIELSTTNSVLKARMLVDGVEVTSGFQSVSGVALADINGVGLTHNNTTQSGVHFSSFKLEVNMDADADIDGDTLPDLWEVSHLGELRYGPYDDPDQDGYNNLAERVGETDPLAAESHPDFAAPCVAFMRDSVVASNALLMASGVYGYAINGISYQEQVLCTFEGYQYTAYYDTVGSVQKVVLARRTVSETAVGAWETVQTDSQFLNGDESGSGNSRTWDAHNVISIGICPQDGTLHLSWDHHNETLRYRKSVDGLCTTNKAAWGPNMLKAEQNWMVASGTPEYDVTYPQFITTPDGGLVFNRRIGISGNGDQKVQVYDPASGAWKLSVKFISRSGTYVGLNPFGSTVTATERCAYINGLDFDPSGTMHVTWAWRESASQYGNRDICYAYSPDMGVNWYNNAGENIADTSKGESITMNSAGITVVPLNMRQLMINQQTQCVDNDGRVHVMMIHRQQEAGHEPAQFSALFSTRDTAYYHYFRDPETEVWAQRRISPDQYPVGSRPCIGYDAKGNLYATYLSYPAGTTVFPGYRENDDYSVLVVAGASKASNYTDWEVLQVVDKDFDGEPLLDQSRLLEDNILAIFIQEHAAYTGSEGIPTPLHVYEFAVGCPKLRKRMELQFMGDDALISIQSHKGTNYQMQVSGDLTLSNGWRNQGPAANGSEAMVVFPDADALQKTQSFYRVIHTPAE